ncbi:hypothetical protein [Streptomyces sp. NPDC051554]|uniref:hypothetical protein n=1 Tax=Streptomyces sp. NPDC051554 TaxID=3365656 RepID=UPI0037959B70
MTFVNAAFLTVGLVVGYAGARARPRQRLGDWAASRFHFGLDGWDTRRRQAALLAVLLLTDTGRVLNAIREERPRKEPS